MPWLRSRMTNLWTWIVKRHELHFSSPVFQHHSSNMIDFIHVSLFKHYLHPGSVHFWTTESKTPGNSESKQHFARLNAIISLQNHSASHYFHKSNTSIQWHWQANKSHFWWPISTPIKSPGDGTKCLTWWFVANRVLIGNCNQISTDKSCRMYAFTSGTP